MKYVHPRYPRITIDPEVCTGQPSIRGMRFPVTSLLAYLSSGMTYEELLTEFPFLERDDILEALSFSSERLHESFFPLQKAA
ncbi:DUF433 domain-containing protein [Spirosoma sp. BT702]|uniref:DUF433 domain-containing protein n=1 Tax=Spirosoma profusum TaxID=2771354 RepID=A0A926XTU0_9BACT|nr:DUF433 domain-containing protein [Spirosoma profusum]MBD2700238.1 DUF433 domain-containing protein [Spirosoma profusum]